MKRLLIFVACFAASLGQSFAQLVPPLTAECATSIDGSVVGVPNPLAPPIVAAAYTGTLGAGNYFVEIVWYDAAAHVTLPSPEVEIQLSATGELQVSPPASGMPANAVGAQVFIGATSGAETLQGSVVGSGTYTQSVPLTTGTALPTTNTTLCMVIANDAGWPSGTGYVVGLTSPSGDTYPGYPMQWQLLGPGNTVNLSEGLPLYNGTVTYPIPILARPYNHGPQSISGPLSLGAYPFTAGTMNAITGYKFNGAAPLGHTLVGNGYEYVDSANLPLGGTPTAVLGTGAGAGATAVFATGSTDQAGEIRVTTGTVPAVNSEIVEIVFGETFPTAAFCVVSPVGAIAAAVPPVEIQNDAPGFYIYDVTTALTASTNYYAWSYLCRGD